MKRQNLSFIENLKKISISIIILYVILYIILNFIFRNFSLLKYLNFSLSIVTITLINIFIIKKLHYLSDVLKCTEKIKDGDLNYKIPIQGNGSFSSLACNINSITSLANECIKDSIKGDLSNIKFLKEVSINNDIEKDELKRVLNITRKSINPKLESIIIQDFINEILSYYKPELEVSNLELKYDYINNNPVKINADRKYLEEVIRELFENLLKYSLKNTKVYIDINQNKNKLYLSIKNICKEDININNIRSGNFTGIRLCEDILAIQDIEFNLEVEASLFKTILVFKIEIPSY